MVREALADGVTIADIVESLEQPVEYVRRVYGNMLDFAKEPDGAFVRIGTTGRGIIPNYRIEPHKLNYRAGERWFDCPVYSGRDHRKLAWGTYDMRVEHWSSTGMHSYEIQALLGKLRNFKR